MDLIGRLSNPSATQSHEAEAEVELSPDETPRSHLGGNDARPNDASPTARSMTWCGAGGSVRPSRICPPPSVSIERPSWPISDVRESLGDPDPSGGTHEHSTSKRVATAPGTRSPTSPRDTRPARRRSLDVSSGPAFGFARAPEGPELHQSQVIDAWSPRGAGRALLDGVGGGQRRQLGTRTDVELGEHVTDVSLHRLP